MYKISVVIPVFNSEKTILRAIESVYAQTCPVEEIIVADDGSTDNSIQIARSCYSDTIKIVRLEQNAGPGAARNAGVKAAVGDWVAFLDSDDEWLPEKLQRQMVVLHRYPELVWCATNHLVEKGGICVAKLNPDKCHSALTDAAYFDNFFDASRRGHCDVQTSSIVVRKAVFEGVGGFDTSLLRHQDWDMMWKIAHQYRAIGFDAHPQVIHHLLYDNPVINERRLEAKKGTWLLPLVEMHITLAKQNGTQKEFSEFINIYIRNSILSMLFIGFVAEAQRAVNVCRSLLSWQQRCLFNGLLTTWPVSLPLLRACVRILELSGVMKFPYRNWEYRKAYRKMKRSL